MKDKGATVKPTTQELITAIDRKRYKDARFLLAQGADPNLEMNGKTPLQAALEMRWGSKPYVRLLLEYGCNIPFPYLNSVNKTFGFFAKPCITASPLSGKSEGSFVENYRMARSKSVFPIRTLEELEPKVLQAQKQATYTFLAIHKFRKKSIVGGLPNGVEQIIARHVRNSKDDGDWLQAILRREGHQAAKDKSSGCSIL